MSKTGKIVIWLIVIVLVIWGISALGNKGGTQGSNEPIKIGFIGPLTGDASGLGTASQAAVQVGADEINAAGGVNGRPIQVIYEDGQCSPVPATSATQKLISVDKVTAIIGGLCSSETSAFAPSAMQNKVITISYCSSAPTLSATGQYFFRTYPSDAYQGKFAADYAYNTLGARKMAIIYHISDWGTGLQKVFSDEFTKLGGTVTDVEGAQQTATDYRTEIAKIKTAGFDHVYIPVYNDGGEILIKQLTTAGIPTSKIMGTEVFNDPKFLADTKGIADGIILTASQISPSDAFKQKMLAKAGGTEVPICAPEAYDALNVLVQGLKQAGTDPDALAAAIRSVDWKGESGEISFDSNGDLQKASYVVKKITNGSLVQLQ